MAVSLGMVIALIKKFGGGGGGGGGGGVTDVRVNGISVVSGGKANIPVGSSDALGVVRKTDASRDGINISSDGSLTTYPATSASIKGGGNLYQPLSSQRQHESVFYGLSKLAGEDLKNDTVTVGIYPEKSLSAISQMLNAPVSVSGATPSITGKPGVRYICGECATLSITAPESGCIDVTFQSGSTPTVLTVSSAKANTTIKWANGFDPTSLEADTTYEINILDGEFGVVGSWT